MKKYLLPKDGNFYKANLHMHTNISDGKMTPLETKEAFMAKGYAIVAFTDHEIMVPHPELTDDHFLSITSTEISVNMRGDCDFSFTKCYHLNLYSEKPLKDAFTTYNAKFMWLKHSFDYLSDEQKQISCQREYSVDVINDVIAKANEDNCLVSYNHPVWSIQSYADYIGLKGLWGVEWFNNGCVRAGYPDTITPIDDLLKEGENVFPLATDDAHCIEDCFGGFVMIKASDLKYATIFEALKKGDFYSSTKPEIDELFIEDGIIHIKTSPVKMIYVSTDRRCTFCAKAIENEVINGATLDINHYLQSCNEQFSSFQYIRITVIDQEGNHAYTRAYHLNELQ